MREYDRTGNGQNGEADWDLRSILCDMAKNWWIILLIACSAAMITYTVLTAVHRDQYTVKTTFAVMGRGENANAASSLSATYEMTQKFQAILENNILKKKVMEELGCSSFPADMSASIVPESNLMELSVTADSPETSLSGTAVGAEELHNHFRLYYSQCSIGDTAAAAGFRQSVEPDSDGKVRCNGISGGRAWYGGAGGLLFLSAGYRQK